MCERAQRVGAIGDSYLDHDDDDVSSDESYDTDDDYVSAGARSTGRAIICIVVRSQPLPACWRAFVSIVHTILGRPGSVHTLN